MLDKGYAECQEFLVQYKKVGKVHGGAVRCIMHGKARVLYFKSRRQRQCGHSPSGRPSPSSPAPPACTKRCHRPFHGMHMWCGSTPRDAMVPDACTWRPQLVARLPATFARSCLRLSMPASCLCVRRWLLRRRGPSGPAGAAARLQRGAVPRGQPDGRAQQHP